MPAKTRRTQTRLTFSPLPSSSPATQGYAKQIQDRAAAVGYNSPNPSKRRKLQQMEDPNDSAGNTQLDAANKSNTMMPTPATSLPQVDGGESDSEPVRSIQRGKTSNGMFSARTRNGPRQKRLDFVGIPSSGASVYMISPVGARSKKPVIAISSDESDELTPLPTMKAGRGKRGSQKRREDGGFMGSSGGSVRRSSRKQATQPPADSESEEIVVSSKRKNTSKKAKSAEPNISEGEDDEQDDDEDEDGMPTTLGTQRRKRGGRAPKDDFISSSPPMAAHSDDDLEIIENPRKRRRASASDEEDDDLPKTPGRRRLKRNRKASQQEKNDLEEELEYLGPSSDVDRRPNDTQSRMKDARAKALEQLKQKRSGQPAVTVVDDEEEEEDEDDYNDDNGPLGEDGSDAGEDDVSDAEPTPKPTSSRQMFEADEGDEEFLVEEDDDQPLGIPDGIPLAFTRFASMKPKELFKYAVEWMVQKKLNPAFRMDDEIYVLTFKKLDDEVQGLAGSKFVSAAWTQAFTMALRSRPDISYGDIDRSSGDHWMRDHCDACNRSNHPATFEVHFTGKPYNRETLDEVADKDDSDDDDEDSGSENDRPDNPDDHPAYDASGREIPPANAVYYVGKFCMANAATAHALQHWRVRLNEWVVDWIEREGYSQPNELVKRDRWSTKKRRKFANKLVDRMEREGQIKVLWRDFRRTIDDAANSKQERW